MYSDTFTTFPTLHTPRLRLRRIDADSAKDLDDMLEYLRDPAMYRFTNGSPPSREELKKLIELWNGGEYRRKKYICWGIELIDKQKLVGRVYLYYPEGNDKSGRKMEIAYNLSQSCWGGGIAAEAIRAVAIHAFTKMGVARLEAPIICENTASLRAITKAGFQNEGTLRNYTFLKHGGGKLHTVAMMACIPQDVGF